MNKNEPRTALPELPGEIRELIQKEIDSGLARLRAGGFDARLKAAARPAPVRRTALLLQRRWAAAAGVALAVGVLALAGLLFYRSPAPRSSWTDAFELLPGMQTLNRAFLDRIAEAEPAAEAESPFFKLLAAAAITADKEPHEAPIPPVLLPKYSLKKKLEILLNNQPIERALAIIKSKSGEV